MPKRRIIRRKRTARSSKPKGRRRLQRKQYILGEAPFIPDLQEEVRSQGYGQSYATASPTPRPTSRGTTGNLRGTRANARRNRRRRFNMMAAPSSAKISNSSVTIGKTIKLSKLQKLNNILYPPLICNMKWTFQMDCDSGRVSAAQIPYLTEPLARPLFNQLFVNLLTDTSTQIPPTMQINVPLNSVGTPNNRATEYSVIIERYTSKLTFYNSSTNTLRARVVWYRPKRDLDAQYGTFGAHTHNPLNLLLIASTNSLPVTPALPGTSPGLQFSAADWNNDFNHAGHPYALNVNGTTTNSVANNTTALLDTSLVPGSPQVRQMMNHFWGEVKANEFTLEPGNQHNISVVLKNQVVKNFFDDADVIHRKGMTLIAVVYVLGQVVFATADGNTTVTTGSSQLSCMREDTCQLRRHVTKSTHRLNLTDNFVTLADNLQGIVNTKTDGIDLTYGEDA
jgi:hypothetical protein